MIPVVSTAEIETSRRTETTVEIREITVSVKPLQKTTMLHRETNMGLDQYGYITVDWINHRQASIQYYIVDISKKRNLHPLEVEEALTKWEDEAPAGDDPKIMTRGSNVFKHIWERTAYISSDGGLLTIATRDRKGLAILRIEADDQTRNRSQPRSSL